MKTFCDFTATISSNFNAYSIFSTFFVNFSANNLIFIDFSKLIFQLRSFNREKLEF